MDEFEMSARYISLHRQLLLGETMTLPEIEEHAVLEDWMNKRCGIEPAQVERAAGMDMGVLHARAVSAVDPFPTKEVPHKDEHGKWVTADGRPIDLAEMARRSRAQMTGQPSQKRHHHTH